MQKDTSCHLFAYNNSTNLFCTNSIYIFLQSL